MQSASPAVDLLREALRYDTVEHAASWPLVRNSSSDVLSYYQSVKKRSDSLKTLMSLSEAMFGVYLRLIVLPVARSPFARTPLKMGDHFASKGANLLETAVPRLKDSSEPLSLDGELLVTLFFLPLSLCLAAAHGILEGVAERIVSVFPPLREAARNFEKKGLLGQWISLVLMVYVYLPLQFVSHPSETIQMVFSIPSSVAWSVINWNISNVMAVLNEVAEWMQWAQTTSVYLFHTWLGFVVGAVEYWYYLVFKTTGLERYLARLVKALRDYVHRGEGTIAKALSSLLQTPLAQWLTDVFANSELELLKTLRALWAGLDDREELKKHHKERRTRSKDAKPQPLPMPTERPFAGADLAEVSQ